MKNIILNLPNLKVSFVILVLSLFFINFFTSSSYKSQSILDVSSENEDISPTSVFDSIVSSGPENAFQLEAFLSSEEASTIFMQNMNVENIFSRSDISFFSRYRPSSWTSFHDYYLKNISLAIDSDSNSLIIDTFAFSPEEAHLVNLQLINMSADFFNRKARMQSFNIKTSKICELYSINSDILNQEMIEFEDDSAIVLESKTANQLLLSKSLRYKDLCLERLSEEVDLKGSNSEIFPFFELKNINADASKQVLLEIYDKSLESVTSSNNLRIIAEPIVATVPENKNALIYSILVFILSFITILSLKVLLRLNDEFET